MDTTQTEFNAELLRRLDRIEAKQDEVNRIVTMVAEQVGPTLESLMSHPMLRAFLGKGK